MALWTGRIDGDQRPVIEGHKSAPPAVPARVRIAGVHQVHGGAVIFSGEEPNPGGPGPEDRDGDAVVASDDLTCAAILVADCVPIAIGSPEGVRAAVHAGWRGLVAGIVQNAASRVRAAGGSSLVAGIGAFIGPCCYQFSVEDLDRVESELGRSARTTTSTGAPSLDLRACALGVLDACGVEVCFEDLSCTSCSAGWYSARARAEVSRQALYVWRSLEFGDLISK
jgi:polyphenol oxidase